MNQFKIFIYSVLFLGSTSILAQDRNPIEVFNDAEFYFVEKQYNRALPYYLELLEIDSTNANFNYLAGYCYYNDAIQQQKSIPYFEKAKNNITKRYTESKYDEEGAPAEVFLLLGEMYQSQDDLVNALTNFKEYKVYASSGKEKKKAENHIKTIEVARELKSQVVDFEKFQIVPNINTRHADFNPVFARDGSVMAFTSYWETVNEILVSWKENDEWVEPVDITNAIGAVTDVYTTEFKNDASELYVVSQDNFNADLYVCKYEKGKWKYMEPIEELNSLSHETSMCLSDDEEMVIFSSNRSGGNGGLDLYYAQKNKKGKWDKPENLGSTINTDFDEQDPYLVDGGNVLFFSSKGHQSMGGYDVFYSIKDEDGKWTKPVNAGYPINTSGDDLNFIPTGRGNEGYFMYDMPVRNTNVDIYAVSVPYDELFKDKLERFEFDIDEVYTNEFVASLSSADSKDEPFKAFYAENMEVESVAMDDTPVADEEMQQDTLEVLAETEPVYESDTAGVLEEEYADEYAVVSEEPELAMADEQNSNEFTEETIETNEDYNYQELGNAVAGPDLSGTPPVYTIQIMALLRPRENIAFDNLDSVKPSKGNDGFTRYTVGSYNSYTKAKTELNNIKSKGYSDAFIRNINSIQNY